MQFNIPAEHKNASGVYIIRNSVNAKVYVGSAVNFKRRHRDHVSQLSRLAHHSPKLAAFALKYGREVLSFELLEVVENCQKQALLGCEQKWLDSLKPFRNSGFNICPLAGSSLGAKQTEQTRRKMSEARKGKKLTQEHRIALAEGNRRRWAETPNEGRKKSIESIAKREATRKANDEARPPRRWSDEARRKASERQKGAGVGKKIPPEVVAKRIATFKANYVPGKKLSEEHKQKISATRKAKALTAPPPTPEIIAQRNATRAAKKAIYQLALPL